MIGKLTPDDPKPNSDQKYCNNCENLVDELDIIETINGELGCTECISRCGWCGYYYFRENMFNNPDLGYCCKACLNCDDYLKASKDAILEQSLQCLFDNSDKRYEPLIIRVAIQLGFNKLANNLINDKTE